MQGSKKKVWVADSSTVSLASHASTEMLSLQHFHSRPLSLATIRSNNGRKSVSWRNHKLSLFLPTHVRWSWSNKAFFSAEHHIQADCCLEHQWWPKIQNPCLTSAVRANLAQNWPWGPFTCNKTHFYYRTTHSLASPDGRNEPHFPCANWPEQRKLFDYTSTKFKPSLLSFFEGSLN